MLQVFCMYYYYSSCWCCYIVLALWFRVQGLGILQILLQVLLLLLLRPEPQLPTPIVAYSCAWHLGHIEI